MREAEGSGASVDEAVAAALAELGASREDVDVEVLDQGGPEPDDRVRVRVILVKAGAEDAVSHLEGPASQVSAGPEDANEESAESANDEWLDDQADLVADFLEDLFEVMDLRAEVEPVYEQATMYVDVWAGEDDESLAPLIGRHGAALDALQEIVRTFVHHRTGDRCQVVVDVEDYRKRRRAQIVSRAVQAARRVQKSGRPERLDPMNAYERKIVHDAVAEVSGVSTGSEGEEPERRVVIRPT